jgi:hypothetical protein
MVKVPTNRWEKTTAKVVYGAVLGYHNPLFPSGLECFSVWLFYFKFSAQHFSKIVVSSEWVYTGAVTSDSERQPFHVVMDPIYVAVRTGCAVPDTPSYCTHQVLQWPMDSWGFSLSFIFLLLRCSAAGLGILRRSLGQGSVLQLKLRLAAAMIKGDMPTIHWHAPQPQSPVHWSCEARMCNARNVGYESTVRQ